MSVDKHPRIEGCDPKNLVGCKASMSLAENKTPLLWRSFMPRRMEIRHRINDELISMQIYSGNSISEIFSFNTVFVKWAAAEVSTLDDIPDGFEGMVMPGGLYAVFVHRGPASHAESTFRYIFEVWLPGSAFELDNRPHFERIGAKYKNDSPDSEEEIWIPIKNRH